MSHVSKVFQLNRQGFNLRAGVVFAIVLGLLIIVGVLPSERRYFLTAIFGAVIVAVSDPGGNYGYRVPRLTVVAVAGALLTARPVRCFRVRGTHLRRHSKDVAVGDHRLLLVLRGHLGARRRRP